MRTLACILTAALLPGLAAVAADDDKERLDAFLVYLKRDYPDKKWQVGPSRLDCPAVRAAYPGRRFFFVFSKPPLPPGAAVKSVQEAYRREVEDIRTNYLSLTVDVDEGGQVAPLMQPEDFTAGLMKVAGDEDARTAAAAILSLYRSGQNGPAAVEANEVGVTKGDKGWSCRVDRQEAFEGTVTFDADGRCRGVSKVYTGPLPK